MRSSRGRARSTARGDRSMRVWVVYALPEQQAVQELELPESATVAEAVARSGLLQQFPEIGERPLACAIYGRAVADSHILRADDRVEILRPLQVDPKESRRRAAARGRYGHRGSEATTSRLRRAVDLLDLVGAVEVHDEVALLGLLPPAPLEVVEVVPALALERVCDHGRAEQRTHLHARHADADAVDVFRVEEISLLDVDSMDAGAEQRRAGAAATASRRMR